MSKNDIVRVMLPRMAAEVMPTVWRRRIGGRRVVPMLSAILYVDVVRGMERNERGTQRTQGGENIRR